MKKLILLPGLVAIFLMSCGNGANPLGTDSVKADAVKAEIDPEIPHEVKKGNNSGYAFMPDTAMQSLVLGNAESWKKYIRENGANHFSLGGNREASVYFNSSTGKKQEMEVRTTQNANGDYIPYAFIVQQQGEERSPELSGRSIPSTDFNFVSGHGIYIGMPYSHVLSIYSNQSFMEWEKGDTLYLQYKPKPKDVNYFKRYKADSYSVTYKFFDDMLRRMEYYVDPKQFEAK
jgi:hypothetical protein